MASRSVAVHGEVHGVSNSPTWPGRLPSAVNIRRMHIDAGLLFERTDRCAGCPCACRSGELTGISVASCSPSDSVVGDSLVSRESPHPVARPVGNEMPPCSRHPTPRSKIRSAPQPPRLRYVDAAVKNPDSTRTPSEVEDYILDLFHILFLFLLSNAMVDPTPDAGSC